MLPIVGYKFRHSTLLLGFYRLDGFPVAQATVYVQSFTEGIIRNTKGDCLTEISLCGYLRMQQCDNTLKVYICPANKLLLQH